MRARIIENRFHNQFSSGDNRQQMKIEEKLPSGSLAMTVVLRSTPPFLSSAFFVEKLQFKSISNNPRLIIITFRGENYLTFGVKINVLPFVASSSSMVALESVDSLT